jgi:hypothetical protein
VGFLPLWPHPSFEASTVACRLGCWSANALSLDTNPRLHESCFGGNGTSVLTSLNATVCHLVSFIFLTSSRLPKNRPLVNITEDGEKLFGKRVLISPDKPTQTGSKGIVFGDLGQYCVRVVAVLRR